MSRRRGPDIKVGLLEDWLAFLEMPDCPCPYEVQQLGRLEGVDMGPGWVRLLTQPGCRHHDRKREEH